MLVRLCRLLRCAQPQPASGYSLCSSIDREIIHCSFASMHATDQFKWVLTNSRLPAMANLPASLAWYSEHSCSAVFFGGSCPLAASPARFDWCMASWVATKPESRASTSQMACICWSRFIAALISRIHSNTCDLGYLGKEI